MLNEEVNQTLRVRWLSEETDWLRENYHKLPKEQVYAHLPRHNISAIKGKANTLHLKSKRVWLENELKYLRDNYGLIPIDEICKHLGRTPASLHIQSVRKLHIRQKSNFYSARDVAAIFGVKCSKTVVLWVQRGWLKGWKSPVKCGKNTVWYFTIKNIEDFVWSRPWSFKPDVMPDSRFKKIIIEEFARDPWYSLKDACKMVGVNNNSATMWNYRHKGWLHPIKVTIEGGNHWTWLYFKSDIDKFLANDPRKKAIAQRYNNLKLKRLKEGRAVQMCVVWQILCPLCKKSVLVKVNSHIRGREIPKMFKEIYCIGGICDHKLTPYLNSVNRPDKPYKVHKSSGRIKIFPPNWPDRKPENGKILELANITGGSIQ